MANLSNLTVQKLPNNTIQIQRLDFLTILKIKVEIDAGKAEEPALKSLVSQLFRTIAPDEINRIDKEIERIEHGAKKNSTELKKLQQQRQKLITGHALKCLKDSLEDPQSRSTKAKLEGIEGVANGH